MIVTRNRPGRIAVLTLVCLIGTGAVAQQEQVEVAEVERPASQAVMSDIPAGADRLFQRFIEDAAVAPEQWWEGQLVYTDVDPWETLVARLVFALHPYEDWEFGGRVGFGRSDTPPGLQDGTGATDLDAWAKWRLADLGAEGRTDVALGGVLTLPTGDDAAGLGTDSFGLELFGAIRQLFDSFELVGNVGFRLNQDGRVFGRDLEGQVSALLGAGLVLPVGRRVSVIGELNFETERFRGAESDLRFVGGVNWAVGRRGLVRGALELGATDGAPDLALTAGYAWVFR